MTKLSFILALLLVPLNAFAEVILYLHPQVKMNETIRVKNIAKVEAPAEILDMIENIEIGKNLFSDGIICREDIMRLLKKNSGEIVFIHGNGVRVIEDSADAEKESAVIKAGESITLSAEKNGIKISMRGIVVRDGKVGETVPVKVGNSKLVRGKILSEKEIMLDI